MIVLTYTDKRGASVIKTFEDIDQSGAVMQQLRREATAKDETGRVVGEVYRLQRGDPGHGVDRRRKWGYWFETETTKAKIAEYAQEAAEEPRR